MATNQQTKEQRKVNAKPVFTLWKHESKNGKGSYFTGTTNNGTRIVGFYNGMKKNPNEPDLRIYIQNEEGKAGDEVASLWCKVAKSGNKYLTGKAKKEDETNYITGFINKSAKETQPYLRIYLNADLENEDAAKPEPKKETKKPVEAF